MAAGDAPLARAAPDGSPRDVSAGAVPPDGPAAAATIGTPNGVRARLVRTGASLAGRLSDVRGRYAVVDATFRVIQTDRRFGGGVLAESVSFRLFLTLLPAALFGVGLLGFTDPAAAGDASNRMGFLSLAGSVAQASADAQRTRWIAVITGFVLFAYAASKLARTIIVATALMWQLPPPKIRWVGATVICVGTMVADTVLIGMTSWLRNTHLLVGLVATVGQAVAWLVTWWWIQTLLPHPAAVRWPQLWRGAFLIGVGSGLLHLATMLLLSSKLASESLLYGAFGTAAVILIGGYYIGRLVVGSASLNAFYELGKVADVEPV